jgi:hypothetical protein
VALWLTREIGVFIFGVPSIVTPPGEWLMRADWGFLFSKEILEEKVGNLGLRDQRYDSLSTEFVFGLLAN